MNAYKYKLTFPKPHRFESEFPNIISGDNVVLRALSSNNVVTHLPNIFIFIFLKNIVQFEFWNLFISYHENRHGRYC